MRGVLIYIFLGIFVVGMFFCAIISIRYLINSCRKIDDDKYKFQEFYVLLIAWVKLKQEGKKIEEYLKKKGYNSIAIYGMKEIGEILFRELKGSSVQVMYVVDRNADVMNWGLDVYKPSDELKPVDAIVVTAIHFFDEIEAYLMKKVDCPILSIEDIVWDTLEDEYN